MRLLESSCIGSSAGLSSVRSAAIIKLTLLIASTRGGPPNAGRKLKCEGAMNYRFTLPAAAPERAPAAGGTRRRCALTPETPAVPPTTCHRVRADLEHMRMTVRMGLQKDMRMHVHLQYHESRPVLRGRAERPWARPPLLAALLAKRSAHGFVVTAKSGDRRCMPSTTACLPGS